MNIGIRLTAVGLATGLAVTACSSDDGDTLHVYSGRHYGIENAFEQFEDETGINVEFLTGRDAELRERIAAEGDDTKADVYLTVDAGNLAAAAQQDLFQVVDSPTLTGAIPDEFSDADAGWYGLALRARTIMYNPALIDEADLPSSYEELAEPEWNGRVCMRVSTNVYQQSLVASIIATHGDDEAQRIVEGWASNAELLNNDILVIEAVADGLCEVGVANHYYLGRKLEENNGDYPVELMWANQADRGVHVNVSGGGITKYAEQPELAQQFLEWLATDGQAVLVDTSHEYPANPDVPPGELVAAEFGNDFTRDQLDAAVYGGLNAEAVRMMDEAGYR